MGVDEKRVLDEQIEERQMRYLRLVAAALVVLSASATLSAAVLDLIETTTER